MTETSEDMLGEAPSGDDVELALSTAAVEAALFGTQSTVTMGRFVLLGELGRGGMGVVYSAWDPQLDRRVALKVVRPELSSGRRDARILREAKAAAQLSDPHIVAVHDVGESEGRLFIAMAYVDGESLEAYTAAKVGVRACVELYLQAARGLATAHAAGIVHRDFKPSNVLVCRTREGLRAAVTDFGVARMVSTPEDPSEAPEHGLTDLTVEGAIVGTPAYMAPEQFEGADVGPAADQFSLCVALFEALFGVRPFEGETVEQLREAAAAGRITAKGRTDAPGGVVAAVRRGLCPDPDDRHPDMAALIAALEAGLHRRRRRLTSAAIVGAVGLAALGGAMGGSNGAKAPAPPQCEALAEAWTDTAARGRALLERMDTGSTLQQSTRSALEDYGQRWVDARRSVCRATHVQGVQSPALLDLRVACLDQAQLEADTLFGALEDGPEEVGAQTLDALARLDAPERCVDANARTSSAPPKDPERRGAFDEVGRGLAEARTDFRLARWKDGYRHAASTLEDAQAYGDDRLLALSMSLLATFEARVGDPGQAASMAKEALTLAVEADDDRAASTIATGLVYLSGYLVGETESAETFGQLALAWSEGDPEQRAAALENLGINAYVARDYDLAEARHREAQTLLDPGPAAIRSAINLTAALTAQPDLGKQREAGTILRETLRTAEETYGADHPMVAALLQNLAGRAPAWLSCEEALPLVDRALEIKTRTLGEDAVQLVTTLSTRGSCRRRLGQTRPGLSDIDRAIRIITDKLGPDSPKLLGPYERRIEALIDLGRIDEAEAQLETVTALATKLYGLDDPENFGLFAHRAAILRTKGRDAEALQPQRRAAEMARKVSPGSPSTRDMELRLARLLRAVGKPDEARALLTAIVEDRSHPGPLAAELRAGASALLDQG